MSATETSLREDLETAIAQFEEEETGAETPPATPPPAPAEDVEAPASPPAAAGEGDDAGKQPQEGASDPAGDAIDSGQGSPTSRPGERRRDARGRFLPDESHPADAEKYPTLTAERVERAPEGWRPAAREGWKDLPEPVRREIHRRELDIASGMHDTAAAREHHERFNGMVQSYRPVLDAEGVTDPMTALDGLLRTTATLRMGSTEQKAARMAGLIQHYGVDLDALDTALAAQIRGEAAPEGAQDAVSRAIDERLAPINKFIEGLSGRLQDAEKTRSEQADQELAAFRESAEFLDDVRLDMADLLDMAAARNRKLSLQEAYDTACQMNPEIRAVLAQRAAQTAQDDTARKVAEKRALADATLVGRQNGAPGPGAGRGDGSLRSDLERAIAQHEEGDRL